MRRSLLLLSLLILTLAAAPAKAGNFWYADGPCYWCIRDGIYHNFKVIAHLEANPDIDEAVKGPPILAARADIRRLRRLIGPVQVYTLEPCCYSRTPLRIR
jgi:hypothetical protein